MTKKKTKFNSKTILKANWRRLAREQVLNYKLDTFPELSNKGNKGKERELSCCIDKILPTLLISKGLEYSNICKEFPIHRNRLDYLIKLKDNTFLIAEVKRCDVSKSDMEYVKGIGQLMAYKTLLSVVYKIPIERIRLALFLSTDSTLLLSVIKDFSLPIDVYVFGVNGVKLYG